MLSVRPLPTRSEIQTALVEPSYRPFQPPLEAGPCSEEAEAVVRPYGGEWEYLDEWLSFPRDLISAFRAGTATPFNPGERLAYLLARTEATEAAGVGVPLERFVRTNSLDLVDRLLLAALLQDALSTTSEGGLRLPDLVAAAGAVGHQAQEVVRERLYLSGALRLLGLLESDLDGPAMSCYYRIAPRMVPVIVKGVAQDPLAGVSDTRVLDCVCASAGEVAAAITAEARGGPIRGWFGALVDFGQWAIWRGPALELRDMLQSLRKRPDHRLTKMMADGGFNDAECLMFLLLVHMAWAGGGEVTASFVSSFVERVLDEEVPSERLTDERCHLVSRDLVEVSGACDPGARLLRLRNEATSALMKGAPGVKEPSESVESKTLLWVEVEPLVKLVDLVLPPGPREDLMGALENVRSAGLIFGEWGFGGAAHCGDGAILLFEGPPGTGKTFAAEAIAGELGRPLLRAAIEKLTSKWYGKTEKAITRLFREASRRASVLLLDEADSLLSARRPEELSHQARHVNVLLQEVEAFAGVLVMTTNQAAVLDPALERRLTARVHFPIPGPEERERLWKASLPRKAPVRGWMDFRGLAERHVLTGSQIRSACLAAARRAAMRGGEARVIRYEDLESAARRAAERRLSAGRVSQGRRRGDRCSLGGEVMSERDSRTSIVDALGMLVVIFALVMFFIVVAIVTFLASPGMLLVGSAKLAFGLPHSGRQVWVLSIAASLAILIALVLAFRSLAKGVATHFLLCCVTMISWSVVTYGFESKVAESLAAVFFPGFSVNEVAALPAASPSAAERSAGLNTAASEVVRPEEPEVPPTLELSSQVETRNTDSVSSLRVEASPTPTRLSIARFRVALRLPLKRAYVMVRLNDREVFRCDFRPGTQDGTPTLLTPLIEATTGTVIVKVWVISPDKKAADEYIVLSRELAIGDDGILELMFDSSRTLGQRLVSRQRS